MPPWLPLLDELPTSVSDPPPFDALTKFVFPLPSPSVTFASVIVTAPEPDVNVKSPASVWPPTDRVRPVPDTCTYGAAVDDPAGAPDSVRIVVVAPTAKLALTFALVELTWIASVPLIDTPGTLIANVPVKLAATPVPDTSSAPLPPESTAMPPPSDAVAFDTAAITTGLPAAVLTSTPKLPVTVWPATVSVAPLASMPKNGPAGMPCAAVDVVLTAIASALTLRPLSGPAGAVLTLAVSDPTTPAVLPARGP